MINSNGGTLWNLLTPSGATWTANVCPAGYRVPTEAEAQSLIASGSKWITQNGINGRLFGSGDNTIFLPAPGNRGNNSGALYYSGTSGMYWSSTSDGGSNAYYFRFNDDFADTNSLSRANGYSVRCVTDN
jgi:uncharacterized protein (TIGR02145 family)